MDIFRAVPTRLLTFPGCSRDKDTQLCPAGPGTGWPGACTADEGQPQGLKWQWGLAQFIWLRRAVSQQVPSWQTHGYGWPLHVRGTPLTGRSRAGLKAMGCTHARGSHLC